MIRNIAVGYDGSPAAQVALEQALDLAERAAARIHLVTAIEEVSPDSEQDVLSAPDVLDMLDSAESLAETPSEQGAVIPAFLEQARLKCQEAHISCTVRISHGQAARHLREHGWLVDLMVIGRCARRRHLRAGRIGRSAHQLLRTAQRPTLVCAREYIHIGSLMVVYEQSATGGRALAMAGELAATLNVPVDVVVAGRSRHTRERWMAQVRGALRAYHVEASIESSVAPPAQALTTLALDKNPSVVVLPQRRRLLGSWRLPTLYRTALQLPDTMVMVVP